MRALAVLLAAADLLHAPGKYPPAAARRGTAHRRKEERGATLSDSERRAWLRLARTENVGPVTFANLIARFGAAAAALDELPRLAARGGGKNFVLPPEDDSARELDALAKLGGRLIAACEAGISARPGGAGAAAAAASRVLGHPHLLQKEMVAIVGARNASALARKFADILARELGFAGLVVVSGLARGIDAAAHEARAGGGHRRRWWRAAWTSSIRRKMKSSMPRSATRARSFPRCGWAKRPQARHFPRRNRLISGLARGVVVVEAAERSGSLITANYALEQGREVFAVPGSPLDPRAQGANRLIRKAPP